VLENFLYVNLTPAPKSPYTLKPSTSYVAQEIGVHLAHVYSNLKYLTSIKRNILPNLVDQESFVLNLHGHYLHLSSGLFTKEYSRWVRKFGLEGDCDTAEDASVRFTKEFDVFTREGLTGADRSIFGLLRYLENGNAKVGVLQTDKLEKCKAATVPLE
jgi:hypothetical protein